MANRKPAELTTPQIKQCLKDVLPPGSFRQRAAECGLLQRARKELLHGRWTLFFPPDAVEVMREYLASLPGSGSGKAAADVKG